MKSASHGGGVDVDGGVAVDVWRWYGLVCPGNESARIRNAGVLNGHDSSVHLVRGTDTCRPQVSHLASRAMTCVDLPTKSKQQSPVTAGRRGTESKSREKSTVVLNGQTFVLGGLYYRIYSSINFQ